MDTCQCFGDSGLHASTYVPVGSDREHCDLCGRPVPDGATDALTAVNRGAAPKQLPETIYLIPGIGDEGSTVWCADPAPGLDMDPADAVRYVRADVAERMASAQAE